MTADKSHSVKLRCDYRWPLIDPGDEDRERGVTHWCRRNPGHSDDHLCACGSRPGDEW
jgi:hypothetical protein